MSAVATREPSVRGAERGTAERTRRSGCSTPRGRRLEDSILATWEELASADRAACPVCGGEMTRRAFARLRLRAQLTRLDALTLAAQAMRSREVILSRKVRTPQGKDGR